MTIKNEMHQILTAERRAMTTNELMARLVARGTSVRIVDGYPKPARGTVIRALNSMDDVVADGDGPARTWYLR